MLTIRFNRTGKRNRASYRVVLQEKSQAPGKRHIEILGSHDPHTKTTILKADRIRYWLGQGAKTSPVVHNLLVSEGVIEGEKIARKMPRPEPKAEAAPEESETPAVTPDAAESAAPAEPGQDTTDAAPVEGLPETPQAEAALESPAPEEAALEAEAVPAAAEEERAAAAEEVLEGQGQ
jgi:small subunit ribosomal protein S16